MKIAATIPLAVLRPSLFIRDLLVSRARPNLTGLERIGDPDTFVWSILPHAARTFTACITLLPAESARAMAVAYLYCRILDTYEDLIPGPAEREAALAEFGARFRIPGGGGGGPKPAPRLATAPLHTARDQTHVVLVNRCHLVDEVFATLHPLVRTNMAALVESMAAGMIWSSRTLRDQEGVLANPDQLSRYCRTVIGLPFVFAVSLHLLRHTGDATMSEALREDCLRAGEMVQLANVTRDIEVDLVRGVSYHPALRSDLGRSDGDAPELRERIRRVREELLDQALALAPSYERMLRALPFGAVSPARASGVLMLLFTDRYYRSCARRVGRDAWPGPESTWRLIALSLCHVVSARWSFRTTHRITEYLRRAGPGNGTRRPVPP